MTTAPSPTTVNTARPRANRLGRLAAWCYDHRRRVLVGWILAVVAIIGLAQWAGSLLGSANWWLPAWIGRATPDLAIEPDLGQLVGGLARTVPVSAEAAGYPIGSARSWLSRRP